MTFPKIEPGTHVVIMGQTGAGKTVCAKGAILPQFDRVLVVDCKNLDFPEFPQVTDDKAIRLSKSKYRFHVRVVFSGRKSEDMDRFDNLLDSILKVGHDQAVYLDEAADFCSANWIPDSLRAFVRKVRARKISLISGTQRPNMLSHDIKANSSHLFVYALSDYDYKHNLEFLPPDNGWRADTRMGSWRALYIAPDYTPTILEPVPKYPWTKEQ